jgi:hypothetical protein
MIVHILNPPCGSFLPGRAKKSHNKEESTLLPQAKELS